MTKPRPTPAATSHETTPNSMHLRDIASHSPGKEGQHCQHQQGQAAKGKEKEGKALPFFFPKFLPGDSALLQLGANQERW